MKCMYDIIHDMAWYDISKRFGKSIPLKWNDFYIDNDKVYHKGNGFWDEFYSVDRPKWHLKNYLCTHSVLL